MGERLNFSRLSSVGAYELDRLGESTAPLPVDETLPRSVSASLVLAGESLPSGVVAGPAPVAGPVARTPEQIAAYAERMRDQLLTRKQREEARRREAKERREARRRRKGKGRGPTPLVSGARRSSPAAVVVDRALAPPWDVGPPIRVRIDGPGAEPEVVEVWDRDEGVRERDVPVYRDRPAVQGKLPLRGEAVPPGPSRWMPSGMDSREVVGELDRAYHALDLLDGLEAVEECRSILAELGYRLGAAGHGFLRRAGSRESAGRHVLPFGKHEGKTIAVVDRENPGYLDWCLENIKSKRLLQAIVDYRAEFDDAGGPINV